MIDNFFQSLFLKWPNQNIALKFNIFSGLKLKVLGQIRELKQNKKEICKLSSVFLYCLNVINMPIGASGLLCSNHKIINSSSKAFVSRL
jgi:hypothetical protein